MFFWASLVAQQVKNPPAMRETWVRTLGWEDPLEKGKATHSGILAWRIPWTVHGVAKSQTQLSDFYSRSSSWSDLNLIDKVPNWNCKWICLLNNSDGDMNKDRSLSGEKKLKNNFSKMIN